MREKIGPCTWLLGLVVVLGFVLVLSPPALAQAEKCGDGNLDVDLGEQCDDGNTVDGDGCSSECILEKCGDGELDTGEECDDGNTQSGDGCSAECTVEHTCGNGIEEEGEECDDGNTIDGDGCSSECILEKCGDGQLDTGEECDDGNTRDGDGCSSECTLESPCGDGNLDEGEQCDDGNNEDGDGCSADCRNEQEGEGCTPGFWKNHHNDWEGYTPDQLVGDVFEGCSVFDSLANDTLDDALRYNGGRDVLGGARIMLRACVAALLNEAHDEVDYSVDGVIGLCNVACESEDRSTMIGLGGLLDNANNEGQCSLGGDNTNSGASSSRDSGKLRGGVLHQR